MLGKIERETAEETAERITHVSYVGMNGVSIFSRIRDKGVKWPNSGRERD